MRILVRARYILPYQADDRIASTYDGSCLYL